MPAKTKKPAKKTKPAKPAANKKRASKTTAAAPNKPKKGAAVTTKAKPAGAPKKKAAPSKAAPSKAAPSKAAPRKPAAPRTTAPRRSGGAPALAPVTRPAGGGRVVEILDDEQPIEALRRYLANIHGDASVQEGQVALGSAQLMLLPIAREYRGGPEVKALLDLVLSRWTAFHDPTGFHAQEFLRNAFAAVGDDRERISRLIELVPTEPSPELQFNIACAHAVAGDKPAMLAALRTAITGGVSPAQARRDGDFLLYLDDPDLLDLLDGL